MFIKETADFLNKLKDLHELLKEAVLVAADVVELYSKKPNAEDLQVLCKQYDKFLYKKLHTEDMIKMTDFVIKKPLFEFNSKFYRQTSRSVVGNKLQHPYASIFYGLHLRQNLLNRGGANEKEENLDIDFQTNLMVFIPFWI